METSDEQAFRDLLDEDGIVRPGALEPPERHDAFTVFAQRSDAALDLEAMRRQAERFFRVKLGLTVDKRYTSARRAPETDAARVVVASADASASGTRLCVGRPAADTDHDAAEAAERLQRTTGMALLARRCRAVWLVACGPAREDDRVALTIAAIFASTFLGPILSPRGDALFGVKTARLRLESPSPTLRVRD